MVAVSFQEEVRIPAINDLASFRRWARSADFPRRGRFGYLAGEVFVDLTMERAFSHNQVKGKFAALLDGLATSESLGYYFHDRMMLVNPDADLSNEPDGMFVSFEAVRSGRLQIGEGHGDDPLEVTGTPDMVLEIISDTSVHKDTEQLRDLYHRAGIAEYWLVDVRGESMRFDLLRRTAAGWSVVRKVGGWARSRVFGRAFRLTRAADPLGNPQYAVTARP